MTLRNVPFGSTILIRKTCYSSQGRGNPGTDAATDIRDQEMGTREEREGGRAVCYLCLLFRSSLFLPTILLPTPASLVNCTVLTPTEQTVNKHEPIQKRTQRNRNHANAHKYKPIDRTTEQPASEYLHKGSHLTYDRQER